MQKKLLALVLLLIGAIGVSPYLPQARALLLGQVNMLGGDRAKFNVTTTSDTTQWFACSLPPFTLARGTTVSLPAIKCWGNFPQDLTVTFSLVNGNTILTDLQPSGTVTVKASDGGTAQCRSASFTSANVSNDTTKTVTLKAAYTNSDGSFSGETSFTGTLTVYKAKGAGSNTDSCP